MELSRETMTLDYEQWRFSANSTFARTGVGHAREFKLLML
jgi:hypothetical protein